MVHHVDAHERAGRRQPAGQLPVLGARGRIARGVRVKDHDRRRRAEDRLAKDVTRLDDRRVQRADRHDRRSEDAVLGVEQHDPELFDRPRPEGRQQVGRRLPRRAQLHTRTRRMPQRPSAQLQRGDQLRGFRRPDARHLRQIVRGRSHEPVQPPSRPQHVVGDTQGPNPRAAAAEHERDELVVPERRGAVMPQLLARPIVGGEVFHCYTWQSCQLSAVSSR